MNDGKLMQKITRAVLLDREIAVMTKELKTLKSELVDEAATRTEEQVPTLGDGASWTMEGEDGCVCRVTFPAQSLSASIKASSKIAHKLAEIAGRFFPKLFEQVHAFKPVDNFRAYAVELLGARDGNRLIKLCESKSSPTVNFETKNKMEPRA